PIDVDGTTSFKLQEKDDAEPSNVSVVEMAARHIRRLAASASDFLGRPVNAAVMTVPTDFTDSQKEALLEAAKIAEIEVLQLINEPTAAVLAYTAREESSKKDKNIVVADFGGTRSDATVLTS